MIIGAALPLEPTDQILIVFAIRSRQHHQLLQDLIHVLVGCAASLLVPGGGPGRVLVLEVVGALGLRVARVHKLSVLVGHPEGGHADCLRCGAS